MGVAEVDVGGEVGKNAAEEVDGGVGDEVVLWPFDSRISYKSLKRFLVGTYLY